MHPKSHKLLLTLAVLCCAHTAYAAGTVMLDDFSSPSSGWLNKSATRASDAGFAVYTDSGKYQMTPVHDHTYGLVGAPRQAASADVEVEADMFLYAGIGKGAAGIACRVQDLDNFYGFIARGDGGLVIVKVKDGKATPLAEGRVEQLMAGAVDTRLSVSCQGSDLQLSARGGKGAVSARDSTHAGGETGLIVLGERLAGTSVTFDNFELVDLAAAR